MSLGDSLTISSLRQAAAAPRRRGVVLTGAALWCFALALSACTIEVGPPPESDPPLVPESAKQPPPPKQPSEPQAWSRDLDFESGPTRIDRKVLAEGLVPSEPQARYSGERLTYESAFNSERPMTEAELARERAKQRAAAAGLPPPPTVAPAPVASVSEQSLPPVEGESPAPRRESRLPPPPDFPPLPAKEGAAAETAAAAEAPSAPESESPATPAPRRESRLPPPPKIPPLPPQDGQGAQTAAAGQSSPAEAPQLAAAAAHPVEAPSPEATPAPAATPLPADPPSEPVQTAAAATDAPPAETTETTATQAFLAEAWDAPAGTILVQISAVQMKDKVSDEWARLKARYPQVLQPLRLVVDEAKLGDRGVFYRVQAGAFGTRDGAAAACESLISEGQACFVVVR